MSQDSPSPNGRHIVSTFDQLTAIDIPLAGPLLPDGKPPAARAMPLQPLEWAALGRSMPTAIAKPSAGIEDENQEPSEETLEKWAFLCRVIEQSVTHLRGAEEINGEWTEVWIPVRWVPENPDRSKGEITMREFNRRDNVVRCWNAIMADLDTGGPLDSMPSQEFRAV